MKYFVTITDENGKEVRMEVSAEIFDAFDEERKLLMRQQNERRRHYDKRGIEDYIIAHESSKTAKSAEDVCVDRESLAEIHDMCTPKQWRRFCLNKIYGYSCAEIAQREGCGTTAVYKSVSAVMKKLKKEKNFCYRG